MILKFEAVDWHSEVYVNRKLVGQHEGGFDGFSFDITAFIPEAQSQSKAVELVVGVYDPDTQHNGDQPRGKQDFRPLPALLKGEAKLSSTYTSVSGIWGTVWIESVPSRYIEDLHTTSELLADGAALITFNVTTAGGVVDGCKLHASVFEKAPTAVATQVTAASTAGLLHLRLPTPRHWSPADPFLYNATIRLTGRCGHSTGAVADRLHTYVGIRSVRLQSLRVPGQKGCAYTNLTKWNAFTRMQAEHSNQTNRSALGAGWPKDRSVRSVTAAEKPAECEKLCTSPSCAAWSWVPTATARGRCVLHRYLKPPIFEAMPKAWCGSWTTRLLLNGKPTFLAGVLSQGFWPDGGYTPPTDAAAYHELSSQRAMGFNFIRKHLMVAPHRWYYYADQLGMLVWQDMPETIHQTGGRSFHFELAAMVRGRRSHPSIIVWSIYNEVSFQNRYFSRSVKRQLEFRTQFGMTSVPDSVATIRALDATRPINAVSGNFAMSEQKHYWHHTDVQDFHVPNFALAGPLNSSLLVTVTEAHRCGCNPPESHMWFHAAYRQSNGTKRPCYGAVDHTGVNVSDDCEGAAATYLSWAKGTVSAIRFFGLAAVAYVQNRDMEGECNGLLTFDAEPKLNSTPILAGNALLHTAYDAVHLTLSAQLAASGE